MNLTALFKSSPGIQDLRAALAKLTGELETARAKHAGLLADRETFFLEHSAKEIEAYQLNIAGIAREVERLEVQTNALNQRIAQREHQGKIDALEAKIAAAQKLSDEAVKLINGDYVKKAKELAGILAKVRDAEELIEATNADMRAAFDSGLIKPREYLKTPSERTREHNPHAPVLNPLHHRVELPDPRWIGHPMVDDKQPIWPPHPTPAPVAEAAE